MGKFGQKAVQEAIRDNESIIEQRKQREISEDEVTRRAALGNFIIDRTIETFPQWQSLKVLNPYNPPRKFLGRKYTGQEYLSKLGFDEDFDSSKLALHVRGDSLSEWMSYALKITKENSSIEDICIFSASKNDNLDDFEKSETHLWKYEDELNSPIEFRSDDYEFVKNIAGLFLPKVLSDLRRLENDG